MSGAMRFRGRRRTRLARVPSIPSKTTQRGSENERDYEPDCCVSPVHARHLTLVSPLLRGPNVSSLPSARGTASHRGPIDRPRRALYQHSVPKDGVSPLNRLGPNRVSSQTALAAATLPAAVSDGERPDLTSAVGS
jgi:hypothetical protein